MPPSRSARRTGFSAGAPESSWMITNTSSKRLPMASGAAQPVNASATALTCVMRPCSSVASTASPMLPRVTVKCCSDSASARALRRQLSFNALMTTPSATKATRPSPSLGFDTAHERPGVNQKYSAAAADTAVATIPGQNPPSHALNMTAGNNVMNGSFVSHSGSSERRATIPAAAMRMAIPYRDATDSVLTRTDSRRIGRDGLTGRADSIGGITRVASDRRRRSGARHGCGRRPQYDVSPGRDRGMVEARPPLRGRASSPILVTADVRVRAACRSG